MKKFFKKFKQNADYSGSIMESGDHFKNGASPKSLTSRVKFQCLNKEQTLNQKQ
jgi:hypothetical protein